MLYATLKTLHLLSLIVWLGGMFFTLACLRPALLAIDAAARPKLMHAAMGRFFAIVNVAIGLILLSGIGMLWLNGFTWKLPHAWWLMIVLGLVMMGIFEHIRRGLYGRLERALQAQDAPAIGATLAAIRRAVAINLVLGVIVVIAMKVGVLVG